MLPSHKPPCLLPSERPFSFLSLPCVCLYTWPPYGLRTHLQLSVFSDVTVCLLGLGREWYCFQAPTKDWHGLGLKERPEERNFAIWMWILVLCIVWPEIFRLGFFHPFGGLDIIAGSGREVPWPRRVLWVQRLWTLPCCPFPGNEGRLSHVGAT